MKATTLQDYKRRMLRVLVHIQQQLDAPLNLDELAQLANFSPYHFHRIFTGMLGESVQSHIRRLRLERAAMRLKRGEHPVTDIAFEAGYETHEAFTRAFRGAFGMSPSHFRTQKRSAGEWNAQRRHVRYLEGKLHNFRTARPGEKIMNVAIQNISDRRVAFVRHVGPYATCGEAWDRLCTFLGAEGMLGGNCQFIGICHDDPDVTPPDKIRYDACVTIDDDFRPEGDIGVQTIPGGDYAVTTHFGPYEKLSETYARLLGQWLPRSGRALGAGPSFEVYLNDPGSTDPADLITDIHAPLEPLS